MGRRSILAALVILACASPALAQTHPCDVDGPATVTAAPGTPATLSVCWSGMDIDQHPTTATGWLVYDNGVPSDITLTPQGPASSVSGLTLYTGPYTVPAAGAHTIGVSVKNVAGEALIAVPFVLTSAFPTVKPTAPVRLQIKPAGL